MRIRSQHAVIIPVLALYSCASDAPKPEAKQDAPPTATVMGSATIVGKVLFAGAKPAARPVIMDATPACARMHKEPPRSEEVVVNADGSLKNVFVHIKSGLAEGKWPVPGKVTVDQNGCIYKPHVVGVMVGQDIEFLNNDDTNHNIHPLPKTNREWNESQPPKGEPKVKQFPQPELMMLVKCNVHPWMRLYVNVSPHPFFAVTGDDGAFELKGLPPGEYTVEAVHERYGAQESKVKVEAGAAGKAEFTFKG
jgi:plastocyanin